jgi:DNA-binding PadR family transcriptional regulator
MEVWEVVVLAEKQMVMTEAFYYILLSLNTPNHGYGIIQNTIELTDGRLELGAGTLYGAINTLLDRGWIRLYSEDKQSRKKKQYLITEQGVLALEQEIERLEELLENGRRVINEGCAKSEGTNAGERKEKEEAADEEVQVVF